LAANNPLPEDLTLRIRELESEVFELKAHVEALTKFSKTHSRLLVLAVGYVLEGMSILRYYANQKDVRIEDIEGAFESIGAILSIDQSCNFVDIRDQIRDYATHLMSCVLELCGQARIGSNELLETLKERFDCESLIEIVNLEDVADTYGLAESHAWRHELHDY
jgi:hypothetical protein